MKVLKRLLIMLFIGVVAATLYATHYPLLNYNQDGVISIEGPMRDGFAIADFVTRLPITLLSRLSESTQTKIGLSVFLGVFTGDLDVNRIAAIRQAVSVLYEDMDKQPRWKNLPSVTGYSAFDLLQIAPQRAHGYVYVPSTASNPPGKAVIFLHGSLGNLKAYLKLWSKFADTTGSIIICPSAGFGNWNRDAPFLDSFIATLPEALRVPREKTIIVGLSAGGAGVAKEIRRHPDYMAAIFISPVMPSYLSEDQHLISAWNKKPFIILHGLSDSVISPSVVDHDVRQMAAYEPKVVYFENESHFLLLTNFDGVIRSIKQALPDY